MSSGLLRLGALLLGTLATSAAQVTYTNFIRQVQFPSGVVWDVSVPPSGERYSDLAIDPGGARFELWTVSNAPKSWLLASRYVGTYIPRAEVVIRSEDNTGPVLRTRADRPFWVDVKVEGLLAGATDPEPSKRVKFLRHVQSYGAGGTGEGIDRQQATLHTQTYLTRNETVTLSFPVTSVPGADRSKVRGEERFSIYSLEDYQAPESLLAAQTIQIWPVADGTISGIKPNQLIRLALPNLTLALNDLYPHSTTYAQAYKGSQQLGTVGKVLPGSALVVDHPVPQSRVLSISNYDEAFAADGTYTIELLTVTPFGIDRLDHVTFTLDRTIDVNGGFHTIE